jgi:serine/threonine protein phosphatase PrpC
MVKTNVINCSVIGASHERSGLPCQDSALSYTGDSYCIIAVADGHGDPRHDLSEIGAEFAVHSATDILKKLADEVVTQKDVLLSRMVRDDFPRLVVRRWHEMVGNDFRKRTAPSDNEAIIVEEPVPYSRYGTTLIAAIVTESVVTYAQIGDGDIVLIREDESHEIFSPNDQNLVGGATLSLAGDEAARRFSSGNFSVAGLRGLFLSTDGLRNCYEDDQAFIRLLSAIAGMVEKEGVENSTNIIREQFVQFSKNGSGDDITLAAVIMPLRAAGKTSAAIKEEVNT